MKIEISPTARGRIIDLVAWWDSIDRRHGSVLETALAETLEAVARHPMIGRAYGAHPQYRMARLRGTPYFAFYRIDHAARVIRISAVWSGVRGGEPELG